MKSLANQFVWRKLGEFYQWIIDGIMVSWTSPTLVRPNWLWSFTLDSYIARVIETHDSESCNQENSLHDTTDSQFTCRNIK